MPQPWAQVVKSGAEQVPWCRQCRRMWEELGRAVCLMLVLEGIIPFLYPQRWRRMVAQLAAVNDRQLRYIGLFSMLLGAGLLTLMN